MDKIFVVDAEILDDLRDDSSRFRLLFFGVKIALF